VKPRVLVVDDGAGMRYTPLARQGGDVRLELVAARQD